MQAARVSRHFRVDALRRTSFPTSRRFFGGSSSMYAALSSSATLLEETYDAGEAGASHRGLISTGGRCFHLPRVKSGKSIGMLLPASDFSLNATNELTAQWLIQRGAARVTASYDMNRDQLIDGFDLDD